MSVGNQAVGSRGRDPLLAGRAVGARRNLLTRAHEKEATTRPAARSAGNLLQTPDNARRECRELEVRDAAAHEHTAILENELPRDSRLPEGIVLEHRAGAEIELKGALFPTRATVPLLRKRTSGQHCGRRAATLDGPVYGRPAGPRHPVALRP